MVTSYKISLKGMTRFEPLELLNLGTVLHLKEHVWKYKKNPTLGKKSRKLTKKSLFGNPLYSDEFHDFYHLKKKKNFFNFSLISKWIAVNCLGERSPYRKIYKKNPPPY